MTDLARLVLEVDARPVEAGVKSLDKLGQAAKGAEAAAKGIKAGTDAAAKSTKALGEASAAATRQHSSATQAFNQARASFSSMSAAQTSFTQGQMTLTGALRNGLGSFMSYGGALDLTRKATDRVGAANDNLANKLRLTQNQVRGLIPQLNDAITMLLSGSSAFQVMTTQGGQVVQVLGEGQGGMVGGFKALGNTVLGFITPLRAVTAGLIGFGVAAYAAYSQYADGQKLLQSTTFGRGRGTGATVGALEQAAQEAARANNLSVGSAREMVAALASTGNIGVGSYSKLIGVAKDYAKTVGIDASQATDRLAKAMSDPAKGAEALNKELNFLDDRTLQYIRTLSDSGKKQEAIKATIDAMSPALANAAASTSIWARAWEGLSTGVSNAFDALGGAIAGPSLEERSAATQRRYDELRKNKAANDSSPFGYNSPSFLKNLDKAGREAADLESQLIAQRLQREVAGAEAKINEITSKAGEITRDWAPNDEELRRLDSWASTLEEALKTPERLADPVKARQVLEEINRIRDAGGTSAYNALDQATFQRQIAGADEYTRGLMEINRQFDEMIRKEGATGKALESINKARAASIDAYNTAGAQRAASSINLPDGFAKTVIGIESGGRANASNSLSSAAGYGGFIDSTFLHYFKQEFSERFAAMGGAATDASKQAILALKSNLEVSARLIEAYAKDNAVELNKAGFDATDRNLYLAHFLDGKGAVKALRADPSASAQGVLGDAAAAANPNVIGGGKTIQDLLNYVQRKVVQHGGSGDALARQTEQIKQQTDLLGASTEALERNRAVQQLLDDARERGSAVGQQFQTAQELINASSEKLTPELQAQRDAILSLADSYAKAAAGAASTRMQQDLMFERSQLGRTDVEQGIAERLRGTYGNGWESNPMAQADADVMRLNEQLRLTKDLAGGALKGFISDLMQGKSATEALMNQLQRIADKLLDMAVNQLISSLFSSLGGGVPVPGLNGARATGGTMLGGGLYLVGEKGPEIIKAGASGTVIPNHQLQRSGAAEARVNVSVINNGQPADVSTKQTRGADGSINLEVMLDSVEGHIAGKMASGRGPLKNATGARPMLRG